jgi:hypothetical protein
VCSLVKYWTKENTIHHIKMKKIKTEIVKTALRKALLKGA